MGHVNAFLSVSGQGAMIIERYEHNLLIQYRKGESILNRLHAQAVINKIVRLTHQGVAYEKQLEVG